MQGNQSDTASVKTFPDAVLGTCGPDLYRILSGWIPWLRLKREIAVRTIIKDFSGIVKDGEMLLVLGRPGSGCSTFLRSLANDRKPYHAVLGEVSYGCIRAEEQATHFKGEVTYSPEDDIHFENLTVWRTIIFALWNKTKKKNKEERPLLAEALLRIFGLGHTKDTIVGNEFTRGVSGGERKRVSSARLASVEI